MHDQNKSIENMCAHFCKINIRLVITRQKQIRSFINVSCVAFNTLTHVSMRQYL